MSKSDSRHKTADDAADGPSGNRGGASLAPLLPAGEPVEALLRRAQFFVPGGTPSPDFREVHRPGGRGAEEFYRERWRHDKVVRSTHGVNCTGSCSWKVYVKDGIITWETQQTDYPSTGPGSPEYEPRGCPRRRCDMSAAARRGARPGAAGGSRNRRETAPGGPVSPFKLASVLLQYPTVALFDGLDYLGAAAAGSSRSSREPFGRFLAWLRAAPPAEVAQHYVETLDLRRRCALYLTYYRYGDTRRRGMAMLEFKAAYRAAGFEPADGEAGAELPDYLPLVLDFAALHPRGEKLLRAHRADLELLLRGLRHAGSPYADVLEAVCAQLPGLRRPDLARIRQAWQQGPPAEEVGLEPFAPPGYLSGQENAR